MKICIAPQVFKEKRWKVVAIVVIIFFVSLLCVTWRRAAKWKFTGQFSVAHENEIWKKNCFT